MTRQDVVDFLARLKEQGVTSNGILQVTKPYGWRPKGFKLRTCFGLVEILNLTDREPTVGDFVARPAHTSITVLIPIPAMERWLARNPEQS